MFLHVSVSHSVHRGGAIPACIAGGIPACLARGCAIPACIAGGIPACLAAGGSTSGGACSGGSTPGGACSWGVPAPGGGACSWGWCGDPAWKQTATVVCGDYLDVKHVTGNTHRHESLLVESRVICCVISVIEHVLLGQSKCLVPLFLIWHIYLLIQFTVLTS